jgi:hypothetical protein
MKKTIVISLLFGFLVVNNTIGQHSDSELNLSVYYEQFQSIGYYENVTVDPIRIQPYTDNPRYWQYKEDPVLLIGG